jgi:hypothetical protein
VALEIAATVDRSALVLSANDEFKVFHCEVFPETTDFSWCVKMD